MAMSPIDEELQILDVKIKQLKLDYEQYFLGSRPREPSQLRSEVQKVIVRLSQTPIQNTAARFRFNSINSRYQAFKRQWDMTLRQIESGTYKRHVFKAKLNDTGPSAGPAPEQAAKNASRGRDKRLYDAYLEAAKACGQSTSGLTPQKLQAAIRKQEAAVKKKLGCDQVKFRVVVQQGKVRLKASGG